MKNACSLSVASADRDALKLQPFVALHNAEGELVLALLPENQPAIDGLQSIHVKITVMDNPTLIK